MDIKKYFKTRSVAFYLCCCLAVLSLIEAFIYKGEVTDPRYYSNLSFFLALFAFLPFILLVIFKFTEPFAPVALALMIFFSLLKFLEPQSGYIGDIVYGATPSKTYILIVVLLLIELGASIACIFMRMSKNEIQLICDSKKTTQQGAQ